MSREKCTYNEKETSCIRKFTCTLTFNASSTLIDAIYWRFNLETQLSELKNNQTEEHFPLQHREIKEMLISDALMQFV